MQKKVTAMRELFLQIRHEQIFLRPLLLLRADGLDQILHNLFVILLKHCYMLVTLRALRQKKIHHNARGLLIMICLALVFLELYAGEICHNAQGLINDFFDIKFS
jgi:hypothetical protein